MVEVLSREERKWSSDQAAVQSQEEFWDLSVNIWEVLKFFVLDVPPSVKSLRPTLLQELFLKGVPIWNRNAHLFQIKLLSAYVLKFLKELLAHSSGVACDSLQASQYGDEAKGAKSCQMNLSKYQRAKSVLKKVVQVRSKVLFAHNLRSSDGPCKRCTLLAKSCKCEVCLSFNVSSSVRTKDGVTGFMAPSLRNLAKSAFAICESWSVQKSQEYDLAIRWLDRAIFVLYIYLSECRRLRNLLKKSIFLSTIFGGFSNNFFCQKSCARTGMGPSECIYLAFDPLSSRSYIGQANESNSRVRQHWKKSIADGSCEIFYARNDISRLLFVPLIVTDGLPQIDRIERESIERLAIFMLQPTESSQLANRPPPKSSIILCRRINASSSPKKWIPPKSHSPGIWQGPWVHFQSKKFFLPNVHKINLVYQIGAEQRSRIISRLSQRLETVNDRDARVLRSATAEQLERLVELGRTLLAAGHYNILVKNISLVVGVQFDRLLSKKVISLRLPIVKQSRSMHTLCTQIAQKLKGDKECTGAFVLNVHSVKGPTAQEAFASSREELNRPVFPRGVCVCSRFLDSRFRYPIGRSYQIPQSEKRFPFHAKGMPEDLPEQKKFWGTGVSPLLNICPPVHGEPELFSDHHLSTKHVYANLENVYFGSDNCLRRDCSYGSLRISKKFRLKAHKSVRAVLRELPGSKSRTFRKLVQKVCFSEQEGVKTSEVFDIEKMNFLRRYFFITEIDKQKDHKLPLVVICPHLYNIDLFKGHDKTYSFVKGFARYENDHRFWDLPKQIQTSIPIDLQKHRTATLRKAPKFRSLELQDMIYPFQTDEYGDWHLEVVVGQHLALQTPVSFEKRYEARPVTNSIGNTYSLLYMYAGKVVNFLMTQLTPKTVYFSPEDFCHTVDKVNLQVQKFVSESELGFRPPTDVRLDAIQADIKSLFVEVPTAGAEEILKVLLFRATKGNQLNWIRLQKHARFFRSKSGMTLRTTANQRAVDRSTVKFEKERPDPRFYYSFRAVDLITIVKHNFEFGYTRFAAAVWKQRLGCAIGGRMSEAVSSVYAKRTECAAYLAIVATVPRRLVDDLLVLFFEHMIRRETVLEAWHSDFYPGLQLKVDPLGIPSQDDQREMIYVGSFLSKITLQNAQGLTFDLLKVVSREVSVVDSRSFRSEQMSARYIFGIMVNLTKRSNTLGWALAGKTLLENLKKQCMERLYPMKVHNLALLKFAEKYEWHYAKSMGIG